MNFFLFNLQVFAQHEIQNTNLSQTIEKLEKEKTILLQQLEESKKKLEDLQFNLEEESITKSEIQVGDSFRFILISSSTWGRGNSKRYRVFYKERRRRCCSKFIFSEMLSFNFFFTNR